MHEGERWLAGRQGIGRGLTSAPLATNVDRVEAKKAYRKSGSVSVSGWLPHMPHVPTDHSLTTTRNPRDVYLAIDFPSGLWSHTARQGRLRGVGAHAEATQALRARGKLE